MGGPALGALLLLLLLLLLLAGRGASTAPEGGRGLQEGALRCPQLAEGAQVCCGGGRLFASCPAGAAQLEGRRRCPREAQTAEPPIQDQPGEYADWKPRVAFVVLFVVCLLLWVAACYCQGYFWQRATFYLHPSTPDQENQALCPSNPPLSPSPSLQSHPPPYDEGQPGFAASPAPYDDDTPAFLICPPFCDPESPGFLGPPPPYDPAPPTIPLPPAPYDDDPPPYSVEDPLDNWDQTPPPSSPCLSHGSSGGEADVQPLAHRNAAGYSSTSTLEANA